MGRAHITVRRFEDISNRSENISNRPEDISNRPEDISNRPESGWMVGRNPISFDTGLSVVLIQKVVPFAVSGLVFDDGI